MKTAKTRRILILCSSLLTLLAVNSAEVARATWVEGYLCYVSYVPYGSGDPKSLIHFSLYTKRNCAGTYQGWMFYRTGPNSSCPYSNWLDLAEMPLVLQSLQQAMYANRRVSVNGSGVNGDNSCAGQINFNSD